MRTLLLALVLAACPAPDDSKDPAAGDTDPGGDTGGGDDSGSVEGDDADDDGYRASVDCDDADPAVHPGAEERCNEADDDCDGAVDEDVLLVGYTDADADGHGDPDGEQTACELPAGLATVADDCDDADADVYPGAPEPDCADPVDYDCDGEVAWADEDGDGSAACEDCDDDDASALPGAAEQCDGVDNDCDGTADDGVATTFYGDADADGYGGSRFTVEACDAPAGYVTDADDCDDLDLAAFPGAAETCDGDDDDCDGAADEDATDAASWWADDDGDGFGDALAATTACDAPVGYVGDSTDCDDADATAFPDAAEACDGVDHDCDGAVNEEDSADAATWWIDLDGDGYGSTVFGTAACTLPASFSAVSSDCDDGDDGVFPGATESCNGGDDDCDGATDEAGASGETTWYRDADGDGYGVTTTTYVSCDAPAGYAGPSTDCDDADATAHPGGTEICDDADDDCDGIADDSATDAGTWYPDEDGDGFGDPAGAPAIGCDAPVGYRFDDNDCDDGDQAVHPYAYEDESNGTDDDCDGATDSADTDTMRNGPSGNDSGSAVNLSGMSFPFCGTDHTSFYMQTNGRVTFSTNDTDSTETSLDFGSDIAIAPAWDDLRTATGSDLAWREYTGAVGIYWIEEPEASGSDTNTFSLVLFDDGRILMEYGAMGLTDGLVGWSCGRGSVGSETDLSAGMAALGEGRWGVGTSTENVVYELFGSDNDLENTIVRLCGNPDGTSDPCGEQ